jgi:hypothetical protein
MRGGWTVPAVVAVALLSSACGARTVLPGASGTRRADADVPRDGGAGDAAVDAPPDAGEDAAERDADSRGPCRRDRDCGARACIADPDQTPVDLQPLALICDALRSGGEPGETCRGGQACDHGICVVAGTCVQPCVQDADCPMGQQCSEVYARTSETTLQPLDACVDRVNLPPDVGTDRYQREGVLQGSPLGDPVELPGADGTAIHVLEASGDVEPLAVKLRALDPMETLLFDLTTITQTSPAPRNPVSPLGTPLTVHVPNGPRSVRTAEGHRVTLRSESSASVRGRVMWRVGRGERLDLDFYYVARGLDDRGELPPRVSDAVDRVASIYASSSIRLGDIRQHEIVGELRRRFSIIEADTMGGQVDFPELDELFRLSAGAGRTTVNVFLVRMLDRALGISGGLPGPQGMHGTAGSGIAVGIEMLGRPGIPSDVDLGRAIAHEIGHFLGLYHTTEVNGVVLEPLPDTPECRLEQDANGDGMLVPSECEDAGAGNLMYWAASGEGLSPDQQQVMGRGLILD